MKNKPYTYDDLARKAADYDHHRKEQDDIDTKIRGAQSTLDSFVRQKEEIDVRVEKAKRELASVLNDLEKT